MSKSSLESYIRESIDQFSNPESRKEKALRMSGQTTSGSLVPARFIIVADSKIPYSPESIFCQNAGEAYVVQNVLDGPISESLIATLEHTFSLLETDTILIAILKPKTESDERLTFDAVSTGILERVLPIRKMMNEGKLAFLWFTIGKDGSVSRVGLQ